MIRVAPTDDAQHLDDGFTLVEVTIVTVLIGLVMVVLATTFTVIVRSAPESQGHVDDARTLRALSTWLAQDVLSTEPVYVTPDLTLPWAAPPSALGFDIHPGNPGMCGSTAGTTNLAQLVWTQTDTATTFYSSNYRFDPASGGPAVRRITCEGPDLATMTEVSSIRLTSGLSAMQDFTPAPPFSTTTVQYEDLTSTLTITLASDTGNDAVVRVASRNP